jgi:hypothetical protein
MTEFTEQDFDKLSPEEQEELSKNVIEQVTELSKKFLESASEIMKPYGLELAIKFEVLKKTKDVE